MNSTSVKKSDPFVSVISLTYNRRENVLELFDALMIQDYANFEIILVDNNSQDDSAGAVECRYPNVKIIRCPQNFGMVSYNFGMANARGKYIIVIDDDGLPAANDWISRIVETFETHPRLGVCACPIRMRDTGLIGYDSPQFVPDDSLETFGFRAAAYNGTGAGLRAEALRQVGYYPFYFYRSWLELHLSTRIIDAGWEVRYFPSLEVWHTRPSGSVVRPITFWGLRNYFWYIWTFYPWPYIFIETFNFLGRRFKQVLYRRIPFTLYTKAISSALAGWKQIISDRKPMSPETLDYLRYVRQHRNDYDLVPPKITYPWQE